MVYPIP